MSIILDMKNIGHVQKDVHGQCRVIWLNAGYKHNHSTGVVLSSCACSILTASRCWSACWICSRPDWYVWVSLEWSARRNAYHWWDWVTSVPILVFLGISVLDLGPWYATDRQTDVRQHHRFMPVPIKGGASKPRYINKQTFSDFLSTFTCDFFDTPILAVFTAARRHA